MGKINRAESQKDMLDPKEKSKITIYDRQIKDKLNVIKQLKTTPIVEIACKRANIGRSTFYRWKNEDKIFSKDADAAMKEGEEFISDMSESQLISLIKGKKFPAIQMWLKHHHPKYTNRLEISGQLITQEDEELNQEEYEIERQALRQMGYKKKYGRSKQSE